MKKTLTSKILIPILMLLMVFTSSVAVFAAETETVTGEANPDDNKTAYQSFDVKANGTIKVESVQYNGKGYIDSTGKNTGEFKVNGKDTFFKVDPVTYLSPGNYYYKISMMDKGVSGVTYDDNTYIVWVYVDYVTDDNGNYLDASGNVTTDPSKIAKRKSIVLQKEDASGNPIHEKPENIEFINTKEETKVIKRTITYTENTVDGTPMTTVTGDSKFNTVTQEVHLKRTVACDADGNPVDKNGNTVADGSSDAVVIGENGNPVAYAADGTPVLADRNGNPVDEDGNIAAISGKDPVATTIWKIDDGKTNDYSGKTSPTATGYYHAWTGAPADANNKKDVVDWFKPSDPTGSGAPGSDYAKYYAKSGNQLIDLNDPKDAVEHVVYTKQPTHTEPETKTITRTIYYKEKTRNGDIVFKKVEQKVELKRDNTYTEDGTLVSNGTWQIVTPESGYGAVTSRTKDGWSHRWDTMDRTPDAGMKDVLGWNDPSNPNKINLEDPKDQEEWVIYTRNPEKVETKTITRTITYTEITPDGTEVSKTVTQTVELTRRVLTDANGNPITDGSGRPIIIGENGNPVKYGDDGTPYLCDKDGNPVLDGNGNPKKTTIWTLIPDKSDTGAKVSPDHPKKDSEGWTPNMPVVGEWAVDLNNPKDEVVHVVYTSDTPTPPVAVEEFLTITRTITYTEYTPNGKEVSKTVTQTVQLKRTVIKDADGNIISVGDWSIVDGDQNAVKSPSKIGWTPDKKEIPFWDIDLSNPQSVILHVIYTPKGVINTGDTNNLLLWGAIAGIAVILLLLLLLIRRRKKKPEDEQDSLL